MKIKKTEGGEVMRLLKNNDSTQSAEKPKINKFGKKSTSLGVKIVCFLAALMVWFYAAGEQSPTHDKEFPGIPVKIEGMVELERQGYTIISGSDASVDVTLMGKRNELNNMGTGDITVVADLSGIYSPGEYPINLRAITPEGTTFVDMKPESITVLVDKSSQKEVFVTPKIVSGGVNDPSLKIEELIPSYSTVRVTGPERELEKISGAAVDVSLSGLIDKTVDYTGTVYLVDSAGRRYENSYVSCDRSNITVTVPVKKYKTVPVEVSFIDKEIAEYSYNIELEKEQVTIRGNSDVVSKIESIKTESVDLSNITGATSMRVELVFPSGIETDDAKSVNLSIFLTNGNTKSITTSNICFINKEEGIVATLVDNSVNANFVGTANHLASLSGKNVYAVADLAGYTMKGTYEVKLDVVYPDNLNVKLAKECYCKIVIDK